MYLKARSLVEDAPAARKSWMIEVEEYSSQKFWPQSYDELTEHLAQISSEYRTPLPFPMLDEDYDWSGDKPNVWLLLSMQQYSERWIIAALNQAVVFVMNSDGDTIGRINI